ncbi:MAG: type IV toxin-antitoxin system AbiEi family antitoxin domain-containing protein [candidate division Zixibacteria bacterium]|nr:type IV toxin-antitoxin system AbiEi family antitoxin domain-containing protein [candidate division Zixibacteria bacterium]
MIRGDYIKILLRSKKTVFSIKDIALLWGDPGTNAARARLKYYVQAGDLHRIRQGLYAKDRDYDRLELASRIFTPSYVSFETVLAKAGVTFQFYNRIFVATYLTREIVCDGQTYQFRKVKDVILSNSVGVDNVGERSIATPERAMLDTLYVNTDYHFDNLTPLNWEKVFELLPLYDNKRMAKQVNALHKHFRAESNRL